MNRANSNRPRAAWPAILLAAVLAAGAGLPALAQNIASIDGTVRDLEGKLFADVVVIIKHTDTGVTYEHKTDKNGRFFQGGLRSGPYLVTFKVKDQVVFEQSFRLTTGEEGRLNINFKEIAAQMSAEQAEARKKQDEAQKKFDTMKTFFETGRASLDRAKQMRAEMMRLPADRRPAMQPQVEEMFQTAINDFEQAQKSAPEKDPNLHLVYANLGEAYEAAGRGEEAVGAYQKAIELKPSAAYYNNLGNTLANLKRIPEAGAAYQKAAELEPANAAVYWRNFGIVLYNSNQLREAIEPLRKATEIDPKNADAWYLLGSSLITAMESKMEGDKIVAIVPPGTAEAFQKYLEIAPDGRFAGAAKASLEQLEALGVGIQTKIRQPKKRN
jgi:tetratricopeptide (TPR) repeat protein